MKIGDLNGASLRRVGTEKDEGGNGVRWIHACGPKGTPGPGYPCNHLKGFFLASKAGVVLHGLRLTPEGEAAAMECGCIRAAREAEPEAFVDVPIVPAIEQGSTGDRAPKGPQGGSSPCRCGSGRKYRRCHGAPGGPAPDAPAYPAPDAPAPLAKAEKRKEAEELAALEDTTLRPEVIRKAERAALRAEQLEARLTRPELERALAKAEKRKERARERNDRRAELRRRARGL